MLSEKDLTIILHRKFCIRNSWCCEWYNETDCKGDVWEQPTHKMWLTKIQKIIKGSNSNIEQIIDAMDVVNEVEMLLKK